MPSFELTLWYLFVAFCCTAAYQTPNTVNKKPIGVKGAFQVFIKSLMTLAALVFFGSLFLSWVGGGEGLPLDRHTLSLLVSMIICLALSVILKTQFHNQAANHPEHIDEQKKATNYTERKEIKHKAFLQHLKKTRQNREEKEFSENSKNK